MAGDLRANREGYRRWSRVAWAATGVLWALLFFAGPDQVASNTFIDRRSDGSAAPDSLFQYVAEHHAAVGALLIALALANILVVVFAAHIAYRLAPIAKRPPHSPITGPSTVSLRFALYELRPTTPDITPTGADRRPTQALTRAL
jgi:hypothetical protein